MSALGYVCEAGLYLSLGLLAWFCRMDVVRDSSDSLAARRAVERAAPQHTAKESVS